MNYLRSFFTTGLLLAAFAACEPFYPTIGVDDSAEKALEQLEVPDGFQFVSQRSALLRVSARDVTQSLVPNAAFVVAFLRENADEPDTLMTAQTTATGWFETTIQWPSSVKKLLIKPFSAAFQPVEFDLSQNTGTIEIALRNQFASAEDRGGGGTDYVLEFDGVDDVVQFDSLFPMHQAGDCSFMVWVKKNEETNAARSIVWSRTNMDNEKNRFNIGIADKWTVDYREPNGITHTLTNGGSAVGSNVCTHIAIVRSGSSYTFYQDGAVVFSRTDNVPNLPTSLGWLLGGRGNNRFKGTMNDLQIWRKALTNSEIQAYMNQPPSGGEADLYGYWSFDEGSGDYALDASPNHRDGKLGNLAPEQKPTYAVNNCSGPGDPGSIIDSDHDGVPDDVDACPDDPNCAFKNYYPAQGALASMIFEDGFPYRGDYDLNDMVIDYNFEEDLNAAQDVVSMKIKVILRAMGASYRNGFAIELPVLPSQVASVTGFSQTDTYVTLSANGTEAGQGKAVLLAFDNGFDLLRTSDGGYVNTDPERSYLEPYVLTLHVVFAQPVPRATLGDAPYNPFLMVNRERGREIHLPGKLPTTLADQSYFGTADDDTNFAENKTYQTHNNLPWALNVPNSFPYLKERQPINQGFLKFNEWAESGGALFPDWFEDKPGYRNTEKIF